MLAVDTQTLFSAPQETASIGNKAAGKSEVLLTSDKAVATFIGIRWDGDKVRGIRMELSDGSFKQAGGYDDGKYTLTQYRFAAGETLVSARLRDSGYGYGSLRQVEFETSLKKTFNAGADGFDHEASLAVEGAELVGFHAWVNSDNFINALAFIVRPPPPKPVVHRPWFATRSVGNQAAAASEVDLTSDTSVVRVISVRWDGDKVRGIRMELRDGTIKSAGGIDDVKYTLTLLHVRGRRNAEVVVVLEQRIRLRKPAAHGIHDQHGGHFHRWTDRHRRPRHAPHIRRRVRRFPRLGESRQFHQRDRVPRHERCAVYGQSSQLFAMGVRKRERRRLLSMGRTRSRSSTPAATSME